MRPPGEQCLVSPRPGDIVRVLPSLHKPWHLMLRCAPDSVGGDPIAWAGGGTTGLVLSVFGFKGDLWVYLLFAHAFGFTRNLSQLEVFHR